MLIAHDTTQTVPYRLKADKEDPPTTFRVGYFDTLLRAHLEKKLAKPGAQADPDDMSDFLLDCVRFGLRGWENFEGAAFATERVCIPGVGDREMLTEKALNCLRLEWAAELGLEIMRINFLTQEAAKN